jgi:hypothetical protein
MDAQPELALLARALNEHDLEAILIGNMAAALHGAPVSTVDIDLFFRKTRRNMEKLKRVAATLGAMILRPYYPVSQLFRLQRESDGLQIDFRGISTVSRLTKASAAEPACMRSAGRSCLWQTNAM